MEIGVLLLRITMFVYLAAGLMLVGSLLAGNALVRRIGYALILLGVALHTGGIISTGLEHHGSPFNNLFESLVFFSWAVVALYLLVERKRRITALGAFTGLIAGATLATGFLLPARVGATEIPPFQTGLGTVHIASCLLGYAALVLAFGAALGYILQERMLKTKRINNLQKHLPPLDVMDQLAYRMITIGFPLLTFGIITGVVWAQLAWGSLWRWDPKEVWSLITWLVYAAYLHVRVVRGWRGKWANRLLIAGFACIVITYLGVNFLSAGVHRFDW